MTRDALVGTVCLGRMAPHLYRPQTGIHYTPSVPLDQDMAEIGDREHLMVCVNCHARMWGYYKIEEEP